MRARTAISTLLGALVLLLLSATGAVATPAPQPAWSVYSMAMPTNFESGGKGSYEVVLVNSGAEPSGGSPIVIKDVLPAGLAVEEANLELLLHQTGSVLPVNFAPAACATAVASGVSTVTCTLEESLPGSIEPLVHWPGEAIRMVIPVTVPPCPGGAESCSLENRAEVQGGGAEPSSIQIDNEINPNPAPSGFQFYRPVLTGPSGVSVTQAGGRAYEYTTAFAVNTEPSPPGSNLPFVPAGGDVKDIEEVLPPGLIGNPTAAATCTARQFTTIHATEVEGTNAGIRNDCPAASAVGLVVLMGLEGVGTTASFPVYNLLPPPGMPAELGFEVYPGVPVYIETSLRSGGDYAVSAHLRKTTEAKRITAASLTIWGTPASPDHDRARGACLSQSGASLGTCPAGIAEKPFWRLSTSCADPLLTTMSFNTWKTPAVSAEASLLDPAPVGCDLPDFSPTIEATPTATAADSPTGLNVDLHVPQSQDPEQPGEADLRSAKVVLPAGMTVNPSSADGLASCSEAQVGYLPQSSAEVGHPRFTPDPAECPEASKLGSVEVLTPLLGHPLPGGMYLAAQDANPFNSMLAVYIAIYDPVSGVVVKLPGRVALDPASGQITASFEENPQLPFSDFKVDLFDGSRAALTTPLTCGSYSTGSVMTPWSAPEGKDASPSSLPFTVAATPGSAPCAASEAQAPNAPGFEAGTASPVAGAFSPFVLKLAREDASQHFSGLNVTLPPGLTGKIAGLEQCSQGAIESALARSHEGEGAIELAHPSCPVGSEVGVVHVGAGSGAPYYVTGHAYFAGPYKGAPFSLVIVTPAVAGPFDLGTVVVRAGLYIDPRTTQATVRSDPFPTVLDGIPLDIRGVNVDVSRREFVLNPTSCSVMSVTGQELSTTGQTASLSDRFQAGGCTTLPFHPVFSASSSAKTSRSEGASLFVRLSSGAGQANIARVHVSLPKQLPSRLDTLKLACRESVFAVNPGSCPQGSAVGTAVAHTPILNSPLTGPAYIVSHGGAAFPDLEIVLQGEGVTIVLDGKTDIRNGITTSTFESVPDAPVSSFELDLPRGPHSILGAPSGLCSTRTVLVKRKVTVRVKSHGRVQKRRVTRKVKQTVAVGLTMPTVIQGQNGAMIKQSTPIKVAGCATRAKHKTKAR